MTDIRQHLRYVNEDIADLEYRKSRLEVSLERVRTELNAKKHAAEEIRREIEATRK